MELNDNLFLREIALPSMDYSHILFALVGLDAI